MFGDLGANSPDCRREKESRPGESQDMLPKAMGTERRRDPAGAQIVLAWSGCWPPILMLSSRPLPPSTDVDAPCRRRGPAANQAFNRLA